MSCYWQHSFVVPITSHLIDRLKSHASGMAEVCQHRKGVGCMVMYCGLMVCLSFPVTMTNTQQLPPPPPTIIAMCSWNQREIWQRGRDPTHPANKLRCLAHVKSNYEMRFLSTRASASAPRPEAADRATSENKDPQYEVRQFTCYVATLPDLDVLVVGLWGKGRY